MLRNKRQGYQEARQLWTDSQRSIAVFDRRYYSDSETAFFESEMLRSSRPIAMEISIIDKAVHVTPGAEEQNRAEQT